MDGGTKHQKNLEMKVLIRININGQVHRVDRWGASIDLSFFLTNVDYFRRFMQMYSILWPTSIIFCFTFTSALLNKQSFPIVNLSFWTTVCHLLIVWLVFFRFMTAFAYFYNELQCKIYVYVFSMSDRLH